jgi:soluble lytic murein transglycosylase-like protein
MHENAKSPKGAIGLMQLMPGTAKQLGVIAADTTDNVRGGAKYLRELLVQYHSDAVLALAAYNAGPGAVKKYGGVPPFAETRDYIEKVLGEYSRLERAGDSIK